MNFITSLPPSKYRGTVYNAIFIVIDRFTKMVKYIPITITIDTA